MSAYLGAVQKKLKADALHAASIKKAEEHEKLASDWCRNAEMGVNKFKSLTKAKEAALKAMAIYKKYDNEVKAESVECKIDRWEPKLQQAQLEEKKLFEEAYNDK